MRALITGASGFAGSHLAEYLLSRGEEVTVILRRSRAANLEPIASRLRFEYADLRDDQAVLRVLRESRPDRLYHLAALSSPKESLQNPELTYDVNFRGTLRLLSACRELELACRVLYVSSAEVYGWGKTQALPLCENSPLRPVSPYAGSKAAAEMLALQFFLGYGLPVIRVRPFHHTGPRQSENFVCSSFAQQVAEAELGLRSPLVSVGNLQVARDFSDVRDVVRGYYLVLEKGQPGEVYQLCSGRAIPIDTILQTLISLASKEIRVVVDESKMRTHDAPSLWGDPSKARELGWQPEYRLETTLRDLKQYWEQRGKN